MPVLPYHVLMAFREPHLKPQNKYWRYAKRAEGADEITKAAVGGNANALQFLCAGRSTRRFISNFPLLVLHLLRFLYYSLFICSFCLLLILLYTYSMHFMLKAESTASVFNSGVLPNASSIVQCSLTEIHIRHSACCLSTGQLLFLPLQQSRHDRVCCVSLTPQQSYYKLSSFVHFATILGEHTYLWNVFAKLRSTQWPALYT